MLFVSGVITGICLVLGFGYLPKALDAWELRRKRKYWREYRQQVEAALDSIDLNGYNDLDTPRGDASCWRWENMNQVK